MQPEYPEFRRLDLNDRTWYETYVRPFSRNACEFSFANLMIWKDFDRPAYTFINGNLCVRIEPLDEEPFFMEPLGVMHLPETIECCLQHTPKLSRISPACAERFLTSHGWECRTLEDHFDYLYRTTVLAEMRGRRFDGKRNHVKRFLRSYPQARYIPLMPEHGPLALALFDEWREVREAEQSELHLPELAYSSQRQSVVRAFEYFSELDLFGGALMVDDDLVAFILGSAMHKELACLHLSYTRPSVPGAFPTLLSKACQMTYAGFEFVNLEQDLGLLGLRKTKLSFYPELIEKKYEVCARDAHA